MIPSIPCGRFAACASTIAWLLVASAITHAEPSPLLSDGQPVNWWFVFKFNAKSFPGCPGSEHRTCPFGGKDQTRKAHSGNPLACVPTQNNIPVSQHFFTIKLNKADVAIVLKALKHASVATGQNAQIMSNGGPADIQALVDELGERSKDTSV